MGLVPKTDIGKVDAIVDRYGADASSLLAILQDLQDEARYLPREALDRVVERLGVPLARIYAMATFFQSFHLKPRGEHIFTVCVGTACHVRGAKRLVEQLERDLKIPSGATTADLKFTLEEVNCVGACALGPLVIINGEYNGSMTSGRLTKIAERLAKGEVKE
ncbi:MAG: NAD(P)H-dependent oxidoreductase subunit E [Deltaproteobacteria bacterium]|nr:NAD(P)H-dependent oxidoreductase subunit E [Deltaproteobacteria bacterium]